MDVLPSKGGLFEMGRCPQTEEPCRAGLRGDTYILERKQTRQMECGGVQKETNHILALDRCEQTTPQSITTA